MEEKKSELIYYLKGVAIISVIYAHCQNLISINEIDLYMANISKDIGTIGVPIFFVISGYLYNNNESFKEFWKKKLKTIIIPWLFFGTTVWGYEVIRKGMGYARIYEWLLGQGTYLWFMTTIVVYWFFLYWIKNPKMLIVLEVLFLSLHIAIYDFNCFSFLVSIPILGNCICHIHCFIAGRIIRLYNIRVHKCGGGGQNLFNNSIHCFVI